MPTYQGSCHCKQCSYSIEQTSDFQFNCFCSDCKKLCSSGHLSGLAFNDQSFKTSGETATYSYDGGNAAIVLHFCPTCSTQLYAYPTAYPNMVVVRANTLDTGDFTPQQNLFQESAFAWDACAHR